MYDLQNSIIMFIPIVGTVSICALLAVAIWASQRRRERELHYRHELHKRLVEQGAGQDELAELLRSQAQARWASRREGLKLGGLLTALIGIGMMLGLSFVDDEAIWRLGWIPTLAGAGALFYAFVLAPRADG